MPARPASLLRRLGFAIALATSALTPLAATAQDQATLISDRLEISGDSRLVAQGHVEVFFQGKTLKASRITFDQATDRLLIEGPIVLTDATGETLILAGQADLASDLTEGILTSARLVLNQQLQLAAATMARIEGRYTALGQVVASSCKVCAARPTPLWEIRAARVVHDEQERQIYFDRAQFRIAGVPVMYLPRLRMPDPTLERANGFLAPSLRTTSELGSGLKIPYFIALGDSRDLTVAPYITTGGSKTLELRYRQAFRTGMIVLEGAVTDDSLTDRSWRGYVFGSGAFALPNDVNLTFGLQTTTDNAYLLDYGYSDDDRLDSRIELSRVRRNGFFSARLVSFQSLRDEDDNDTLPSLIADATFHRRFSLGPLGGEGGLRLQSHSHYRTSSDGIDPDLDGISNGRDTSRLSARIDWRRGFVLPMGIEATLLGEAQMDGYTIRQDDLYEGRFSRSHTAAGAELRWPWVKATATASHVIEPVVQLIWADRSGGDVPNEDSILVEFDEGNIFALDRFPGSDAVERGARANIGIGWTRYDPAGWSIGLTLGRVFRDRAEPDFGLASGLSGDSSDWLAAAVIDWSGGLTTTTRLVMDDDFSLTKGEARLDIDRERLSLAASALWVVADAQENRPLPSRELRLDTGWQVNPALQARFTGSYDFESERGTLAGMGMEYRNECVSVDLSLSRRFTSSDSVTPTTSFELSVDLIGFGSGQKAGPSRRCY